MNRQHAPCPEIVTYERRGTRRAPRWIAKWVDHGMLFSPTFEGVTEAAAVAQAHARWTAEQVAVDKAMSTRREAA